MISAHDIVYISGPMTGLAFYNYFNFYAWAGVIAKEYGCEVLNPARHRDDMPYQFYMERAVEDIRRASVIVLLDGWKHSRGVKIELTKAAELGGIRVIENTYLLEDIYRRMALRNPVQKLVIDPPQTQQPEDFMKNFTEQILKRM